jgi:hypothetical protein
MSAIPTIEFYSNGGLREIPREKVYPNQRWIKHVHCDGARFHVLSWYLCDGRAKIKCSEPDCIYNRENEEK